ncbi:phage integrase family protein [Streptomyces sp. Ag109_O5-1]|nr:phage integrase family protein [Streptomyces sp. Ag109_O5-1]
MDNQWRRIRATGKVDIPEGMVRYGTRHFYASNCLSNGIPITDVAEWMGHKSVDVTFKISRLEVRCDAWPCRRPGIECGVTQPSLCC